MEMEREFTNRDGATSHQVQNNCSRVKRSSTETKFGISNFRTSSRDDQQMSDKSRIGFLNQCKLELSAEVIRWKEENLKLRKENEAAVKKIEELQSSNNKLLRKNHELESNLMLSSEENKRLRMRSLAVGEENSVLHEKLSKNKFHTYPSFEFRKQISARQTEIANDRKSSSSPPPESWEDVSKKLFRQMQQEMREVQKLSLAFCEEDQGSATIPEGKQDSVAIVGEQSSKEVEQVGNKISELISQSEMLKRHLKLQNEKLLFLLNHSSSDVRHPKASTLDYAFATTDSVVNNNQTNEEFKRPSDETFRAYFTQQLSNNRNGEEMRRIMQTYFRDTKIDNSHIDVTSKGAAASNVNVRAALKPDDKVLVPQTASKNKPVSRCIDPNKKVCPICEYIFSKSFPYSEFEAHVVAHLEDVSASLIDQYEIASQM